MCNTVSSIAEEHSDRRQRHGECSPAGRQVRELAAPPGDKAAATCSARRLPCSACTRLPRGAAVPRERHSQGGGGRRPWSGDSIAAAPRTVCLRKWWRATLWVAAPAMQAWASGGASGAERWR